VILFQKPFILNFVLYIRLGKTDFKVIELVRIDVNDKKLYKPDFKEQFDQVRV
jgi:hypothetical protein